jgi:transcriptional regulator with XRE-family HTH domain
MKERKKAYRSVAEFLARTETKQQEFARRVGISPTYVSMIVHGQRRPSLRLALRIARVARVPIRSLVPKVAA